MTNLLKYFIRWLDANPRVVLIILIGFLLVVGTIYSFILGNNIRYADEQEYLVIAKNIATSGSYSFDAKNPTAYRQPGYPVLLSFFVFLGSGLIVLRLLNIILLAGAIYFLYRLLEKNSSPLSGILSVFLVLFYPVLFYTAGTFYPQMFAAFLLLLFLYLVFDGERLSMKRAVLSGIVAGMLMLTVSTFIGAVFVVLIYLMMRRNHMKVVATVIISSCLVIGTWTVRNYSAFHSFIPFSTNSGINLLLGNSPNTTPNAGVNVDLSSYESRASVLNEIDRDAYYKSEAITYISENTKDALVLYGWKVLNYFNFRNDLATKSESSATRDVVMLVTYYALLLLLLLRLCFLKKYKISSFEMLLFALYLLNPFIQAIFFTRIRFRAPFDFLLIALVANYLGTILKSWCRTTKVNAI